MTTPTNNDDVIDSRDVIAAIAELTDELDAGEDIDTDELDALRALADQGEDCEDWQYGATLIRDSYFKDYAIELAEDIGAIGTETERWPFTCIDWDQAARELRMDYTSVEFDGVTYWVR